MRVCIREGTREREREREREIQRMCVLKDLCIHLTRVHEMAANIVYTYVYVYRYIFIYKSMYGQYMNIYTCTHMYTNV